MTPVTGLRSDPTAHPSYVGSLREIGGHPMRPWARYSDPKPQCAVCSVGSVCTGCRHDDGCTWCFCDGLGCSTCGTKCRSHESRELWQADVGSMDLWVDLRGQPELMLPRFVPSVKLREKMKRVLPPWTYTVAINDLVDSRGEPRPAAYRVRRFFPEGSQLILNFFAPDRYLEPIWTAGAAFWEGEWLENFDAVVAVNYSLYADDSSFELMHSLKRSYVSAQEISDAGYPTIPLIAAVNDKQLAEQIEALWASEVNTVALNLQVVVAEKAEYQEESLRIARVLAEETPWRVLCHGIARREVIEELARMLGDRLVVSNADPYFLALRRSGGVAPGASVEAGAEATRRRTFLDETRRFLALASPKASALASPKGRTDDPRTEGGG